MGGAAVFGVGWGLAGYCPGPAVVALGFAPLGAGRAPWGFFATMVAGVLLGEAAVAVRGSHARAAGAPAG